MKILFICTGNTCRSPMAQELAKQYLVEGIEISSAGINASEEVRVSEHAVKVLKEKGIDLSRHTAVRLTKEMLDSADYVFTMTKAQEAYLESLYPEFGAKINVFGHWLGSGIEVTDPWGSPIEVYRSCLQELEEMTKALAVKLSFIS